MNNFFRDVKICQLERTEELNREIMNRNIPSSSLQMQFDPRAVPTRTTQMPILDAHKPAKVAVKREDYYNMKSTFNPGSHSPYAGYALNVDDESRVRNTFSPNQQCAQGTFIPGSNSDLYYYKLNYTNVGQPYAGLFEEENFAPFNPNRCDIGKNYFRNYTKQQVKDLK